MAENPNSTPRRKPRLTVAGERYGRLVAIELVGRTAQGQARWRYRCDCGADHVTTEPQVKRGFSKSCGCLRSEALRARAGDKNNNFRHGMSRSSEYRIWRGMVARCHHARSKDFKNYGARGIKVCDRWTASFEAFYADNGPRPSTQHEIDRINNDGNYEPGNCRWATKKEQANNRRKRSAYRLPK